MKIKCDYCGKWIEDTFKYCPNCGAYISKSNSSVQKQIKIDVPKTIDELKEWSEQNNIPLVQMNTYIGVNYKGQKAFGIYQDEYTGEYIVYKNKANGSRSIRYQGNDEAYAVNELYLKMKERVAEQKSINYSFSKTKSKKNNLFTIIIFFWIAMFIMAFGGYLLIKKLNPSPNKGYYTHDNSTYYYDSDDWYEWYYDDWSPGYYEDDWMYNDYDDYYDSYYYDSSSDYYNFNESEYYDTYQYDNDDYWDYDSDWDTSYDDWDSDW